MINNTLVPITVPTIAVPDNILHINETPGPGNVCNCSPATNNATVRMATSWEILKCSIVGAMIPDGAELANVLREVLAHSGA